MKTSLVKGAHVPELPRLGYGAANIGNLYRELTDEQADAVLDAAWRSGVRYYDTAPHYGLGLSERRLGAFLATKPRTEFVISTKVGRLLRPVVNPSGSRDVANDFAVRADFERTWDLTADGIRRSLDESLERMGLDRVDILFLHDPEKHDLDAADREAYPAMIALREERLVSRVGVGSMSMDALTRAASYPGLDTLMIAGRLTLAERGDSVVPLASANGMDIVAAGVFNSGLLATTTPGDESRYEYGAVPTPVLTRVRAIAAICQEFGVDLPTAALQYPLRLEPVRSVVVGGSRPEQLIENTARMAESIPEELWHRLADSELIP